MEKVFVAEPADAPVARGAETAELRVEEMVAAIAAKGDFPAAARVIQRLHDAVRRENCNALDVAQVILADPGLSSKVLRVVNSSFYRPRGEPVSTITRAVFLLGFEAIRDLATGLVLIDELARAGGNRAGMRELLHHCLLCGSVARSLSTAVGYPNPEEAYLLGLFANWGELCLAAYYPDRYERARRAARGRAALEEALGTEFGLATSDLATAMLARWNFPGSYADYFRQSHPTGDRAVATNGQRLIAIVDVANDFAAYASDPDPEMQAKADAILRTAETMFGRRIEDVRAAAERGAEDAREHLPMLRSTPSAAPTARATGEARAAAAVASEPAGSHLREVVTTPEPTAAALAILAEITRAILAQDDINDTLAMVLEGVARTGQFDVAFLALLNGKKDHLVGRLGYGHGVAEYLSALRVPLVPEGGALADAVLTRAPKVVAQGSPVMLVARGAAVPAIPASAFVAHPLVVRGKAVGVMVAARAAQEPALGAADVTLVQLFCNQAGLALDRAVG